jgi:inhibitor of KinA sporulation pathway (predicted exonuclease)
MEVLIIVDVESTCWKGKGSYSKVPEIIELGGTTLTNDNGKITILGSFSEFVKPKLNPVISKFCYELTSIQQSDIEDASDFKTSLKHFKEKAKKTANGMSCKKMIFGSWSPYDRTQIRKDCKLHDIKYSFGRYWDIEKSFSEFLGEKRLYSVSNALSHLGLKYDGKMHRAIDDSFNTAVIVKNSMKNNWMEFFLRFEENEKRKTNKI